jgi:hypothetical protein
MNKFFALLIFFFAEISFAATFQDAEDRIRTIENLKNYLTQESGGTLADDEFGALNLLYDVLEKDEYTATSLNGDFSLSTSAYSLIETKWTCEISGDFFDGAFSYERSVDLLYSTVLEKKYVAESEMTEYQRRDYEYYVNEYENRLQSGEEIFYAELNFKITHWENPGEYRFEPVSLKIYKILKRPKLILTIDETSEKEFFIFGRTGEFRSQNQIASNSARINSIVQAEEISAAEKNKSAKQKKSQEQKGRRAFYIFADMQQESLKFPQGIYDMTIDEIQGILTFGIGKFFFAGVSVGFDLSSVYGNSIYSFGGTGGINFNLGGFFRPYADAGISARTDDKIVLKFGAGLDVKFGHFMLNFDYAYNFKNNLDESADDNRRFHSFGAGIGLTW